MVESVEDFNKKYMLINQIVAECRERVRRKLSEMADYVSKRYAKVFEDVMERHNCSIELTVEEDLDDPYRCCIVMYVEPGSKAGIVEEELLELVRHALIRVKPKPRRHYPEEKIFEEGE